MTTCGPALNVEDGKSLAARVRYWFTGCDLRA